MSSVQCSVYSVECRVWSVKCRVYSVVCKHTTELLSPQAPASPSSLPPARPLPFRAPLRPVSSLNEPPVPLPPTLSSPFPTFPTLLPSAPSSYTFLPSLQGLPTPTPNTASPCRPLRPSPDAPTNPPPQSLPCSPLSCPRSNLTLAFVPSSQVFFDGFNIYFLILFDALNLFLIPHPSRSEEGMALNHLILVLTPMHPLNGPMCKSPTKPCFLVVFHIGVKTITVLQKCSQN